MNIRVKKPNPNSYYRLVDRYHVSEKYILSIFRVEAGQVVRIVASGPVEVERKRWDTVCGQSPGY
jgi:hypothetical protein